MRVAIVGSRRFSSLALIEFYVSRLPKDTIIVSGGAKGVDSEAEAAAKRHGLAVTIHYTEWEKYGRSAGMRRNGTIIDDADKVVAFWDGKSPGTKNSIERAIAAKKPCFVVYSSGEWRRVSPDPCGPGTPNARGLLLASARTFEGGVARNTGVVPGEIP